MIREASVVVCGLCAVVTGCASLPDRYAEPGRPRQELAVVSLTPYAGRTIEIHQIDGRVVGLTNHPASNYWKQDAVALSPGRHMIDIYTIGSAKSAAIPRHQRIVIDAQAGHVYEVSEQGDAAILRDLSPPAEPGYLVEDGEGEAGRPPRPAFRVRPDGERSRSPVAEGGGAPEPASEAPVVPAAPTAPVEPPPPMSWHDLNERLMVLSRQGAYAEAAKAGEEALRLAQGSSEAGPAELATASYNLAYVYRMLGRADEAEPLLTQAIVTLEQAGPSADQAALAMFVTDLAGLYQEQGRYAQAEPLYERVFNGLERTQGRNHPETMAVAANLALVYQALGRDAVAQILFERVLAFDQRVYGANDSRLWIPLHHLALLCHAHRQYAKAEPLYQRAITLRGVRPEQTAASLTQYARLLRDLGRLKQAKAIDAKAQRIVAGRSR